MMQTVAILILYFTSSLASRTPGDVHHDVDRGMFLAVGSTVEYAAAEKASLAQHFELDLREHGTICMWLSIGLVLGCCCFSGVAHSLLGQLIGGFFNCILPLGIFIYVCIATNLFHKFWKGEPINTWCLAICIWTLIQLTCGICCLCCWAFGFGIAASMGKAEEES